jgi:hypothetical protein
MTSCNEPAVVCDDLQIVLETDAGDVKPLYITQVLNLLHRIISIDKDAKSVIQVCRLYNVVSIAFLKSIVLLFEL